MKLIKYYDANSEKVYALQNMFKEDENGFVNVTFGYCYAQFIDYQQSLKQHELGLDLPQGYVPYSVYVLVDDSNNYVGIFNLRHFLNDFLRNGPGHIGMGIAPQYRKKGYASEGLKLVLEEAKKLGIQEVYMSCNIDNPASLHTQLHNKATIHHEDEQKYYTRILL